MNDAELDALDKRLSKFTERGRQYQQEAVDALAALTQLRNEIARLKRYESGVMCPGCDRLRLEMGEIRAERDALAKERDTAVAELKAMWEGIFQECDREICSAIKKAAYRASTRDDAKEGRT